MKFYIGVFLMLTAAFLFFVSLGYMSSVSDHRRQLSSARQAICEMIKPQYLNNPESCK